MKMVKEPPVGAATALAIRSERRRSMDLHSSSLGMASSLLADSRKLLASRRASRKLGG